MKTERKPYKTAGSCSYCNKLSNTMTYPYTQVIVIEGNCISTRMCDECLDEFLLKAKKHLLERIK